MKRHVREGQWRSWGAGGREAEGAGERERREELARRGREPLEVEGRVAEAVAAGVQADITSKGGRQLPPDNVVRRAVAGLLG
eukprot:655075-Rhodomonas_salina.1